MATCSAVLCGICHKQHVTKDAEYWCPECEEGLCGDCHKYHSIAKASESHSCIPVEQYNKLPSSISKIVHHCKDHGIKYTNYCTTHDTLCCPDCISTTHGKCRGFLSLREIIKTAKTSTLLNNMEQSLKDIETNIEKVIQDRKENLSTIKQQRQKIHYGIKKLRAKINSHLDYLEQNLLSELNTAETKIQTKVGNLIDCLSKKRQSIHLLKASIESLKEHASDLQIFLGSKMYQPEVGKVEKYLQSLSEDGSLEKLNLSYKTNDSILETLRILTFGSVSIEKGPPTCVLTTKKEKQAQIIAVQPQSSPWLIHEIKLSLLKTYSIPKTDIWPSEYRGCIIHPSGKLIFTDHVKAKLVVLNADGTEDKYINCSLYVNDLTAIDDTTVAVSTNNGIDIIDIHSRWNGKVIKNGNRCYGITHHKRTLLWCQEYKGLERMDLSDWSISTLVKQDGLPCECYVTTNGKKIYQTNYKTNIVTCYTMKGEKIWEYINWSILNSPVGITVDNNGNCYVASYISGNVVMISLDGKKGKEILSQTGELYASYGIHYVKTRNNLLIVNRDGPAFLYHAQKR